MMRDYGLIIHNLQKKLDLPLTEFDIYIGDEYEEDEDESKNKDEFDLCGDRDHYGNDRGDDKEELYDTSNNVPPKFQCRMSDEELLEIAEKPIYYSGQ